MNKHLKNALKNKNDEFYTMYEDIEFQCNKYKDYFKDKIIYCNCDDYSRSNFVKYFLDKFNEFGIKKLIATAYNKSDLLNNNNGFYYSYNGVDDTIKKLKGDGSFDSPECIKLLKEADIIITNPPYSIFNNYMDLLLKYNKTFLIVGTILKAPNKKYAKYIVSNEIHIIPNSKLLKFIVPNEYDKYDGIINDVKYKSITNCCWFTNLPYVEDISFLKLNKSYYSNPELYPKYDNYPAAINVNKINDIPYDYSGEMGVPVTFLLKYNTDQFEIVGFLNNIYYDGFVKSEKIECLNKYGGKEKTRVGVINNKICFGRIIIKNKMN